jgi:hypothetical protein
MFRSITTKVLVSLISMISLLAVILGVSSYVLMTHDLKDAERANLEFMARRMSVEIRNYFANKSAVIERVAADREIDDYAEKFQEMPLFRYFAKFEKDFPVLIYVNEKGSEEVRVVNGALAGELRDVSSDPLYRRVMKRPNSVVIMQPEYSRELGEPVIRMGLQRRYYFGSEF